MHSLSLSSDSATLISWFTQIIALYYRNVHISVPIHSGSSWIQWDTVGHSAEGEWNSESFNTRKQFWSELHVLDSLAKRL